MSIQSPDFSNLSRAKLPGFSLSQSTCFWLDTALLRGQKKSMCTVVLNPVRISRRDVLMNSMWICCSRPVLQSTEIIWSKTCLICFPAWADGWAFSYLEPGLFPGMPLASPGWREVWYPAQRGQNCCCTDQSRQHILMSAATHEVKALM